MKSPIEKFAAFGLAATIAFAIVMTVHLSGQPAAQISGDFRHAGTAEVRDAQGQVLLRGTFAAVGGDQGEVERKAQLTATESGGKASGEAEVEYSTDEPNVQEIEFQVTGVPARAVLTLVLDGVDVISATANDKGRAEAEVDIAVAGMPAMAVNRGE